MKFLNRLCLTVEAKAALGVLAEAEWLFDPARGYLSDAFDMVRDHVKNVILTLPAGVARMIREGTSPRQWVYAAIANAAGDLVESGRYHYRGSLDPNGPGNDLLRLFDAALDELVRIGAMEANVAETEKGAVRTNLKYSG